MTVSVAGQAQSLAVGLLLGAGIGLCYDLFRILRCRLSLPAVTVVLDLLFWLGVTLTLFAYAYRTEGGRVRIYLALALLGGGTVYFRLFSRLILRLGYRMVDVMGKILGFFLTPLAFVVKKSKKFLKKLKNIFLSRLQWYKIIGRLGVICRYSRRSPGSEGGQKDGQNQESRYPDKNRRPRSAGLFCHRSAQSEQSDRRR